VGIETRSPIFLPWSTPAYSNAAFALLGLALENITSKTLNDVFRDRIFRPLRMDSSSYTVPQDLVNAVVPGGTSIYNTTFGAEYGPASASGGVFSTLNDVSKLGIGILNSTLLATEETRKWLKPVAHTNSLDFSVGRPWEIIRVEHGRTIDLYTKAGDSSAYSSYLVLSPDHGAGFTVLVASATAGVSRASAMLSDILSSIFIPALETQAAVEAAKNFAGTYTSKFNSSMSLSVDQARGLQVTSWISNGTDFLSGAPALFGTDTLRLFPAISSEGRVAFRTTSTGLSAPAGSGAFTKRLIENSEWESIDTLQYGAAAIDLFFFELSADGRAATVTPAATREVLARVE
jgi:Beta-lactamase